MGTTTTTLSDGAVFFRDYRDVGKDDDFPFPQPCYSKAGFP